MDTLDQRLDAGLNAIIVLGAVLPACYTAFASASLFAAGAFLLVALPLNLLAVKAGFILISRLAAASDGAEHATDALATGAASASAGEQATRGQLQNQLARLQQQVLDEVERVEREDPAAGAKARAAVAAAAAHRDWHEWSSAEGEGEGVAALRDAAQRHQARLHAPKGTLPRGDTFALQSALAQAN